MAGLKDDLEMKDKKSGPEPYIYKVKVNKRRQDKRVGSKGANKPSIAKR